MTRAEVLKLAKAKLGKDVIVYEEKKALDPETRNIIQAEFEKIKTEEPVKPPEVIEYERRWHEWNQKRKLLRDRLFGLRRYRIEKPIGLGNRVEGHGDSWEEAARSAKLIE